MNYGQIKCITCEGEKKSPWLMTIPDLGALSIVPNLNLVQEIMNFMFIDHKGHTVRADL